MKFAFCVESGTDQDVLSSMLSTMFQEHVEPADVPYVFRGFTMALSIAPNVARLAYDKGLDGAVFAIDNDGMPSHVAGHVTTPHSTCRMCRLRDAAAVAVPRSWPRPALAPLRYLFAVPVQTIETWLLHLRGYPFKGRGEILGSDPSGRRLLKKELYGMEDPDRQTMREKVKPILDNFKPEALASLSPSFRDFLDQVREIQRESPASTTTPASSHE